MEVKKKFKPVKVKVKCMLLVQSLNSPARPTYEPCRVKRESRISKLHAHAQNQPIGINGNMRTLVLVLSGWHNPRSRLRHLSEKISYVLFFFF